MNHHGQVQLHGRAGRHCRRQRTAKNENDKVNTQLSFWTLQLSWLLHVILKTQYKQYSVAKAHLLFIVSFNKGELGLTCFNYS
ncbi:hypothetical protein CROQUDRAFT_658536 [Cronartium quercuum f. sp. fusiforme G11]|uniref:Uncharacterized protein n=1 Tax=Cronartium quercuum f. sp. fusiforme G11 TaxID=708437 RepID=A0A9P6NK34_9BASI|nr:hypothetical protein CROQUDRAFT_658536 [Cronartium quercuum f. sp. fusiforme G11]